MQVPAESRIRMADMLRLLFHFFNIVNLTLGLIVFGIGVSLTASPLPIEVSKEISLIYGTLLVTAVVVILMGIFGIHSCYWVQSNGLKLYAVLTCVAIMLDLVLGSMTIMKKKLILDSLGTALTNFNHSISNSEIINSTELTREELTRYRVAEYDSNTTYKAAVNGVHQTMSCCSFPSLRERISSCYHNNMLLPPCSSTFEEFIKIRLGYIMYLSFILVPVQVACLGFDLLVLKTLLVTKEYAKLERELSNKKKRNSHGYISISEMETSVNARTEVHGRS